MKKKLYSAKLILLSGLILLNSIALCGCWNYRDIEKSSLVSGFAIDKNKAGDKYMLTVEIIDYEMSGKEAKQSAKYIQSEGKTVFDAIRNVIDILGKRLYWAHASIVIISEEIAKEGIIPAIDLILRDAEIRSEMYILISTEKTAGEVLLQDPLVSQTSSDIIEYMLAEQKDVSKAPAVEVYKFLNDYESGGSAIPAIKLTEHMSKKTAEIAGTAIFKTDKLIGYLNTNESKCFLFVRNEIKRGLITLNENSINDTDNITLEIFKSKTKLKPSYADNKLTMNIDILTEVSIAEMSTSVDYSSEKNIGKLKKDAEEKIKASIEAVIKKVQLEYNSDIFDFGTIVKAYKPSVWRQIEQDWDESIFKGLEVAVNVRIKIRNCGFSSKPLYKNSRN
ncbi:spore germination protein KC [Ruminiclostridium sufflavum DSM 19573]|uniref:Spore germination protein KC n=1 Tax=Ruminiclostridium sufflavum DSM 19573 TaxID=1121337 RepID=A0A318XPT8_9FIRM|nr:Ger(x)C family spore germination protein [Ruminiclostridium sufflavum]PYG87775.1 spore germination protein KC [Ruminiclostridium sufflavum DSM 19573]